jgi:2-(1,2-epoxy-1,2-dihydrophenyl)acetyl-CoA isomerase
LPIVTAINGPAAGIGCSIALLGDIVVAAESAYFLQAFRRIGLVPDGGSTYLLPRLVGKARAMEMMLLGDKIPAATALSWGLVNRCVADAELMPAARAIAQELANGPAALSIIRRLVWDSLDADWADQLNTERRAQRAAGKTDDFIEGVSAFLQKRPAAFKGR